MNAIAWVLCLVSALALADSKPPVPGPAVTVQEQQPKAASREQDAHKDERGTDKSPLVIKAIQTEDEKRKADDDAADRKEKSAIDRSIRDAAWLSAAVALLLFIVAAVQAWLFLRQLRFMRDTANVAKQSADAAAALVRAEMPFLTPTVTEFNLHEEYPAELNGVPENAIHLPMVTLAFTNIGRTPAVVERMGAKLILGEEGRLPKDPPPFEAIGSVDRSDAIPSGGTGAARIWGYGLPIYTKQIAALMEEFSLDPEREVLRFYLVGFVVYRDGFNYRHTSRFCLKVRQNGFFAARGGTRFNNIQTEEKPSGEPVGRASVES